MLRWCLKLLMAVFSLFLTTSPTHAQEHDWLKWQVPPECPPAQEIKARLDAWLGAPFQAQTDLLVEAKVDWNDDSWVVQLNIRYGEDNGERIVSVKTCAEAADFVALTVALLINPELSPTSPPRYDAGPVKKRIQPAPSDNAHSETPPPEKPSSNQSQPASPPVQQNSQQRWFAELGGGLNLGALPRAAWAPVARLGLMLQSWRFDLGVLYFPEFTHQVPSAMNDVRFSLLTSQLGTCYQFDISVISVGPCLSLQIGLLTGQEATESASLQKHLWIAGLAGALIEGHWAKHWGAYGRFNTQVPFTQPKFKLEGNTVVHQPQGGFQGDLGFRYFF